MSFPHFVNLCSDDETEAKDKEQVLLDFTSNLIHGEPSFIDLNFQREFEHHVGIISGVADLGGSYSNANSSADGFLDPFVMPISTPTVCRQFWKAGDYDFIRPLRPVSQNGQNRLRVDPKFLHSNATSHKWAFGAVAELLDNAIDEVQNGASYVLVDKITNIIDGSPALLIQDDGGGMGPESLRHCMSFGFSNKQSDYSIGQYGNGFKTSTMRLGADVIVFSRCRDKRNITQSVGLLSFTFLKHTNCDDIVVPMVDYEIDPMTGVCKRLIRHGQKRFDSNLETLLRWSPFATEDRLLKQFCDMGHHGTKVIVFNLWFNEDGDMELDFDTHAKDIMISGAPKTKKTKRASKMLDQNHIATRYSYSLRVYSSILYLHLPLNFRIILRGQDVDPHHIVNDLNFRECIKYKPQGGGSIEHIVITTIGFLEGAPDITIHGFNVYHKNRLILPFWPVFSDANNKCRGVAGVLEVNFMKPTHNKQDFERSNLYQKLEMRLKDMALEYWDYHCHLIGFPATKNYLSQAQTSVPTHQMNPLCGTHSHIRRYSKNPKSIYVSGSDFSKRKSQVPESNAHLSADRLDVPTVNAQTFSSPGQFTMSSDNSQTELPRKRRHANRLDAMDHVNKPAMPAEMAAGFGSNQKNKNGKGHRFWKLITMVRENKKLQTQCLEMEKAEKQLLIKVQKLRVELLGVQLYLDHLLAKLKSLDDMKLERISESLAV